MLCNMIFVCFCDERPCCTTQANMTTSNFLRQLQSAPDGYTFKSSPEQPAATLTREGKWLFHMDMHTQTRSLSLSLSLLSHTHTHTHTHTPLCFQSDIWRLISYDTISEWLYSPGQCRVIRCFSFTLSLPARWVIIKTLFPINTNFYILTNCLQPKFRKCWDVFLIWIKWKLKDFQITWANILFTIEHREHKCLKG